MNIGVIGTGSMGGAIVEGLIKSDIDPKRIYLLDHNEEKLQRLLNKQPQLNIASNEKNLLEKAQIIIIVVQKQKVQMLFQKFQGNLTKIHILVSVVAEMSFSDMKQYLIEQHLENDNLIRFMPNTAIAIKQSASIVSLYKEEQNYKQIIEIFKQLGSVTIVPEEKQAAGSILCSCQTAFILKYIRAVQLAGIEMGISAEMTQEIVGQTLIGTASLLKETNAYPEPEIDKIMTPGGVTIKGINELEKTGFTTSIIQSLKKCME